MQRVIRTLAPDEVVWFLSRSLAFQGHGDAMGLARRLEPLLRDTRLDASMARVWHPPGERPLAGVVVRRPGERAVDSTVGLAALWHEGNTDAAHHFVRAIVSTFPHEAMAVDLHGVPAGVAAAWLTWLAPLGFAPCERVRMAFDLTDVPPLGLPLMLDAWRQESDTMFRRLYADAEGIDVGDAHWSWRKRHGGRFEPDLWFLARETPDQEPMGYAFCNGGEGFDAQYRLEGAGVVAERRSGSESARRLVLTVLQELAGRSPLGRVVTECEANDRPWIDILHALGFMTESRRRSLERTPGGPQGAATGGTLTP